MIDGNVRSVQHAHVFPFFPFFHLNDGREERSGGALKRGKKESLVHLSVRVILSGREGGSEGKDGMNCFGYLPSCYFPCKLHA